MKVQELIEILENMDPDATVLLATQPAWPFEYSIEGVVTRWDFTEFDPHNRFEHMTNDGGLGSDPVSSDVLLLEGTQLRYGTKAAWEAARR